MQMNASRFVDQRCFRPLESVRHISEAQRQFYNEHGYAVFEGVVPRERAEAMTAAAHELYRACKVEYWFSAPEKLEPSFDQHFRSPEMQQIVEDLNGPSDVLLGFLLRKKARDTRFKPWHQDGVYWGGKDQNVCAVFTPLTEFTEENGALYVIPGTHKLGRLYHHEEAEHNLVCSIEALRDPVLVRAKPGDLIAVHSLTVHASLGNDSDAVRINLGCHWQMRGADVVPDDSTAFYYGRRGG